MTLRKIAGILNALGAQANAGEHTLIIRDLNANVAVCEFGSKGAITIIDIIRDNKIKHIEFDPGKYTDFKILKLMMEVAGGLV